MLRPSLVLFSLVAVGLSVLCPNPEYSCPETSTCCLLADDVPPGEYGCCPMPFATCCEDHLHCCPSGQSCDVEQGTCTNSNGDITKFHTKQRARKTNDAEAVMHHNAGLEVAQADRDEELAADIICPGGKDRCPDQTTCCELEDGQYGCCPSPNAVCCRDKLHCCPDGMRCDSVSERCKPANSQADDMHHHSIPWLRKFPSTANIVKEAIPARDARPRSTAAEKLKRPINCGNAEGCREGHTCCQMETDTFLDNYCCPMADAVCCSEGCCKSGWKCGRDGRSCERPALTEEEQYLRLMKKAWRQN